jgi:hypothetical protein
MRILSIPNLIKKISYNTIEPSLYINAYKGKDWENMVSSNPISLWKNEYMELKLINWKTAKMFHYHNNYITIHSKVLDGKILSRMSLKNDYILSKYIKKNDFYTLNPSEKVSFISLENSVTIQLFYYHNLY